MYMPQWFAPQPPVPPAGNACKIGLATFVYAELGLELQFVSTMYFAKSVRLHRPNKPLHTNIGLICHIGGGAPTACSNAVAKKKCLPLHSYAVSEGMAKPGLCKAMCISVLAGVDTQ